MTTSRSPRKTTTSGGCSSNVDPELLRKFEALFHTWKDDIVAFAEMMGTKPWSGQEELLRSYQELVLNDDHEGARRMIVKSAQGVGKTRSMAVAALWHFFRHKDALVIVRRPTASASRFTSRRSAACSTRAPSSCATWSR